MGNPGGGGVTAGGQAVDASAEPRRDQLAHRLGAENGKGDPQEHKKCCRQQGESIQG